MPEVLCYKYICRVDADILFIISDRCHVDSGCQQDSRGELGQVWWDVGVSQVWACLLQRLMNLAYVDKASCH